MRVVRDIRDLLDRIWERRFPEAKVEQLQKLYVGKSRTHMIQIYRKKLESAWLILILVMALLFILSVVFSDQEKWVDGQNRIRREDPNGNSNTVELETGLAGDQKTITVEVAPRAYTAEELQAKFEEAKQYVQEHYLGENESADHIIYDLQLMSGIPDSAIGIEWQLDTTQLIETDGSVRWDQIDHEVVVEITAYLHYGAEEESLPLVLTICPPERSKQEQLWREWEASREILAAQTATNAYLQLPQMIGGNAVQYREVHRTIWQYLLLAGCVGVLVVPVILDSRMRQGISRREKELIRDYPELIEQYVLLIGAGMTIKGTWIRIATEYLSMRQKGQQEYRFLYEEMLVTMRELESGMSEIRAYELFGKRMGLLSYMKFSTLLVQNLRKGSDDLLRILEYEATDAFRERKEHAKSLGEEAGTKLLMPMMLMLLVVLIMIIYAAFCSM